MKKQTSAIKLVINTKQLLINKKFSLVARITFMHY